MFNIFVFCCVRHELNQIALLVGMVLFVVNEANRVENQVIMQMVFIDVSCQNKLILAA